MRMDRTTTIIIDSGAAAGGERPEKCRHEQAGRFHSAIRFSS
jgi:hypothetical protein